MGSFSFGRAIGAGFGVIGRNPLAVAVWALVYLVFVIGPTFAVLRYVLPDALAMAQQAAQQAAQHPGVHARPDPVAIMALRSRTSGLQPALWVLSMIVNAIVIGAIFRAVLEPENRRFAYLRLSRQELWLGLTYLVLVVMMAIMVLVLILPIGIAAGVSAALGLKAGSGLVAGLVSLVGIGLVVWVALRLSLALPMSFAQGRFLLYESWDLTRGQTGKMFGVYAVLILGLLALELAILIPLGMTVVRPMQHDPAFRENIAQWVSHFLRTAWPLIAGFAVVASVLGMAVRAITVAPLAEVYRELTAHEAAADAAP
jgi:hypothetical protein